MAATKLKKLTINKFRALSGVEIEIASNITVICGKNGTSKSSILGVAAQIFSFHRDYKNNTKIDFRTVTGEKFKSFPNDHFRISDNFDVPGSMDVEVLLHDGHFACEATARLELMKRGARSRPVVRNNSTATVGNTSRNFTHPVIFLSLRRLMPIAIRDYEECASYISDHENEFITLNNSLLNKTSSVSTSTTGELKSAVAHGSNYDHNSVSAGEDNAGQIVLAIMSFRKLKKEYADYKGGLLLIDEADAGLFPAAQISLLDMLEKESKALNLQVIMTSHSPTLIEAVYGRSQKHGRMYKTIYLSDTYGGVNCYPNMSWSDIYSDLHTKTVSISEDVSLPRVNVYFEDREGYNFFNALLYRSPLKKYITPLDGVSLGCSNYLNLVDRGVPEFSQRSIIILDADVGDVEARKTIVKLPGGLPPDQLIFEFLYNLPASNDFWSNKIKFTHPVLRKSATDILSSLSITENIVNLSEKVSRYRSENTEKPKKVRDMFKEFYNGGEFQKLVAIKGAKNPWNYWVSQNRESREDFVARFSKALVRVMTKGYGVDPAKCAIISASSDTD